MKKLGILILAILLVGCAKTEQPIEIPEDMFETKINDIQENRADYIGKRFVVEGMYNQTETSEGLYQSIYRRTPGCCGDDGMAGFRIVWNGEYPERNDWIRIQGVLEEYMIDGTGYLQIAADDLTYPEVRGLEFVQQ